MKIHIFRPLHLTWLLPMALKMCEKMFKGRKLHLFNDVVYFHYFSRQLSWPTDYKRPKARLGPVTYFLPLQRHNKKTEWRNWWMIWEKVPATSSFEEEQKIKNTAILPSVRQLDHIWAWEIKSFNVIYNFHFCVS